ncbi:MAG TPA: hypothetical protein VGK06_07265 [Methanosarcina sp.]
MTNIQSNEFNTSEIIRKVPEITLMFWIIKVFATTLGETGGDAVTMSMNLGYLTGTMIFTLFFVVMVIKQIHEKKLNPYIYWITIVATTTLGTTLADFCTRSIGIGYTGGSTILFVLLIGSLFIWKQTMGSVSIDTINSRKTEMFFWGTIMFSQTLGTALGDWTADSMGLGYSGAAIVFVIVLLFIAAAYFWTKISPTALFWAAFILTRPLGAAVGDFLDKPISSGGLALSRYSASAVLLICIVALIFLSKQKAKQAVSSSYSAHQNMSADIDYNEIEEYDK